MSTPFEQDERRWQQDRDETTPAAALPPVRSEPLLAAAFADFWHAKWPHQTRDVKRLEMSAHYVGCRDAFEAGAQAAKAEAERVRKVMRSALSEAENELRCFGSFDGHITRWEQRIDAANAGREPARR